MYVTASAQITLGCVHKETQPTSACLFLPSHLSNNGSILTHTLLHLFSYLLVTCGCCYARCMLENGAAKIKLVTLVCHDA